MAPKDPGLDRQATTPPDDKPSCLQTNKAAAVVLSIVFTGLLLHLLALPETFQRMRDGFFLGIIPLITVAAMLLCSLTMMFDGKRNERFHASAEKYCLSWSIVGYAMGALVAMYVYYWLVMIAGYVITTLLFLPVTMFILGIRSPRVLCVAALIITGFVYGAFTILGFRLPGGIIAI